MPLPIRERGYARPELLAETDWLAARLSDTTVPSLPTYVRHGARKELE